MPTMPHVQTMMSMRVIPPSWSQAFSGGQIPTAHLLPLPQNIPDGIKKQQLCPESEELLAQLPTPGTTTARMEPPTPLHHLWSGPSQQGPEPSSV